MPSKQKQENPKLEMTEKAVAIDVVTQSEWADLLMEDNPPEYAMENPVFKQMWDGRKIQVSTAQVTSDPSKWTGPAATYDVPSIGAAILKLKSLGFQWDNLGGGFRKEGHWVASITLNGRTLTCVDVIDAMRKTQ